MRQDNRARRSPAANGRVIVAVSASASAIASSRATPPIATANSVPPSLATQISRPGSLAACRSIRAGDTAQQRIAGGGAISRIHHLEPSQRDQDEGATRAALRAIVHPAAETGAIDQPGERIAIAAVALLRLVQFLDATDDRTVRLQLKMMRHPPERRFMRERRGPAILAKPAHTAPRRAQPARIEEPRHVPHGQTRTIQCEPPRQGRRQLHGALARLPSPIFPLRLDHCRAMAGGATATGQTLGVACGEADRLLQLDTAERRHQEMGGPGLVQRRQPRQVGSVEQHQQRGGIRLHHAGQRLHRLHPVIIGIARVDDRDRRAARHEPPRRRAGPACSDHGATAASYRRRQRIPVTERQQEKRRCVGNRRIGPRHAVVSPSRTHGRP